MCLGPGDNALWTDWTVETTHCQSMLFLPRELPRGSVSSLSRMSPVKGKGTTKAIAGADFT